jgi:hypothetical protein
VRTMAHEQIAHELRTAATHAAHLQSALIRRQRMLYDFDETATRGKYRLDSPAVIIDQAEDIRRSLVQDVEEHLVPIVKTIADSDRVVSPLLDHVDLDEAKLLARSQMLLLQESNEAASNLAEVEAALSRTSQLSPSNEATASIALLSADDSTAAMERAQRAAFCLTEYLPALAMRFEDGPKPGGPMRLTSVNPPSIANPDEKARSLTVSRPPAPDRALGQ